MFATSDEAAEEAEAEEDEEEEEDLRVGDVDDCGEPEPGDRSGERLFSAAVDVDAEADAVGEDTRLSVESFIDESERPRTFAWLASERVVRRSVLEPRDDAGLAGTLARSARRRVAEGLLAGGVRAARFFGGFGTGENLLRGRRVE